MSVTPSIPPSPYPIPTTPEMLVQQVTANPELWLERLTKLTLQLAETLAQIQTSQQAAQQYEKQITDLKLEVAEFKIYGLTQARVPRSERTPDVDRFDGSRDKLPTFVAECRIKFIDNADRYPTQDSRMNYVFTRCIGAAKEQLLPYWEDEQIATLAPFKDVNSLMAWLQTCFGDPDPKGTAQFKISRMRMANRDFPQHLADFNKYIERTGWNEEAKKSSLMSGLSAELKNLLIHHDTESMSLQDLTNLCMRLDTKARANQSSLVRSSRFGTNREATLANPSPPTMAPALTRPWGVRSQSTPVTGANLTPVAKTTTQGGDMMDMSKNRGPIPEAEKQRRRANRLCLYCGESGHFAEAHRNGTLGVRVIDITEGEDSGKEPSLG